MSSTTNGNQELHHGLTAVPSSASTLITQALSSNPSSTPIPIPISSTPIPTTELAERIHRYAEKELSPPTFNHSLRVYHYGLAIKQFLFPDDPDWAFSHETYFLACMLHDIGTTEKNLRASRMSFEFMGGILALEVLIGEGMWGYGVMEVGGAYAANFTAMDYEGVVAERAQAESVAEAIIRHQDIRETGKITALGQLLQLATIYDNTGKHHQLLHPDTVAEVVRHYPRPGWSACFAATVREEITLKPWAHTTALGEEDFPETILANSAADETE